MASELGAAFVLISMVLLGFGTAIRGASNEAR
jgi:hypothetical protein